MIKAQFVHIVFKVDISVPVVFHGGWGIYSSLLKFYLKCMRWNIFSINSKTLSFNHYLSDQILNNGYRHIIRSLCSINPSPLGFSIKSIFEFKLHVLMTCNLLEEHQCLIHRFNYSIQSLFHGSVN